MKTEVEKYFASYRYCLSREVGTARWTIGAVYWSGGWPRGLPVLFRNIVQAWWACYRINRRRK
jgi:hypothetical protein